MTEAKIWIKRLDFFGYVYIFLDLLFFTLTMHDTILVQVRQECE